MKTINFIKISLQSFLLISFTLLSLTSCSSSEKNDDSELTSIRVGWQTAWATQGQLTQVLRHTNVLEINGLEAEFKGFSYGGPLNEAALAGEVDVLFTADQPAAMLLTADSEWEIIGRLMYNRVAIYVPPDSPIDTLSDLRGKTVAMPYGAAAQRVALEVIQEAGLDPQADINSVNLDIYEQSSIVQAGTRESWGEIDALVGFDPTPAIFEYEDSARMLYVGSVVSVIVMSEEYITKHPNAPTQFLTAFTEAYLYYAQHQDEANDWFVEESRLSFDPVVLDIAASVEPNVSSERISDIRIVLTEEDLVVIDRAAEFIFEQGLTEKLIDMRGEINMNYAQEVERKFASEEYDPLRIEVKR